MGMGKFVCKKVFILIACVMVVFSFSFSSYATTISSGQDFSIYLSTGSSSQIYPIAPISSVFESDSYYSTSPVGYYSGYVTARYYLSGTGIPANSLISGYFLVNTDVSVYYRPLHPGHVTVYDNFISVSVADVSLSDSSGNSFFGYQNNSTFNAYLSNLSCVTAYDVSYHVPSNISIYCKFSDLSLSDGLCFLSVTFSVSSARPLTRFSVNSCSVQSGSRISSFRPYVGGELSELNQINENLDSLENKTDTTNNKLQNLTDGYSDSAMNNTNQELSNQLGSYDQAEDAAIDSVTDYFGQIQQPISFFNASSFLTSTSFVWTYLQGIYEHLGDAKIVVDVVLALIVAFSFIGLGKYIWRVADREDDS